jgi:hypothetical protein
MRSMRWMHLTPYALALAAGLAAAMLVPSTALGGAVGGSGTTTATTTTTTASGATAAPVRLDPNIGHIGYCSVSGNTKPDGFPIPPGTFLTLVANQPQVDPNYSGAYPAIYVEGTGITCAAPPAGYVRAGFAPESLHVPGGVYPYWVRGS